MIDALVALLFLELLVCSPMARAPVPINDYTTPQGMVQASSDDANGLVGLEVAVFDNFWAGYERAAGRTKCPVTARCVREYRHPDGARTLT